MGGPGGGPGPPRGADVPRGRGHGAPRPAARPLRPRPDQPALRVARSAQGGREARAPPNERVVPECPGQTTSGVVVFPIYRLTAVCKAKVHLLSGSWELVLGEGLLGWKDVVGTELRNKNVLFFEKNHHF